MKSLFILFHLIPAEVECICIFFYDIINDRNGMDLTEAEDIKKRWQEYTEELSKTSS